MFPRVPTFFPLFPSKKKPFSLAMFCWIINLDPSPERPGQSESSAAPVKGPGTDVSSDVSFALLSWPWDHIKLSRYSPDLQKLALAALLGPVQQVSLERFHVKKYKEMTKRKEELHNHCASLGCLLGVRMRNSDPASVHEQNMSMEGKAWLFLQRKFLLSHGWEGSGQFYPLWVHRIAFQDGIMPGCDC